MYDHSERNIWGVRLALWSSLALLTSTTRDRLLGSAWDLSTSIWLRGFFSGYSGFPPSLRLCSEVMHGLYSGSQGSLYMLSVQPRWAALPLYFEAVMSASLSFLSFLFTEVTNEKTNHSRIQMTYFVFWLSEQAVHVCGVVFLYIEENARKWIVKISRNF